MQSLFIELVKAAELEILLIFPMANSFLREHRLGRSKDDWAKTYVLDSAFGPFVQKNKNILPEWFIQAIQSDLNAPIKQSAFDTVQVFTTSKDEHN